MLFFLAGAQPGSPLKRFAALPNSSHRYKTFVYTHFTPPKLLSVVRMRFLVQVLYSETLAYDRFAPFVLCAIVVEVLPFLLR